MIIDHLFRIQHFGDLLAANYAWDNPFQTTSKGSGIVLHQNLTLIALTERQPLNKIIGNQA